MTKKNNQLLMLLSTVGLLTFTACTDDKYDLNDLDTTIGVGSDEGLTLPTSSTRQIFLDDLLELNNSESVVIRENGDYVFEQKGDDVESVQVMIDKISILDNGSTNFPVNIDIPNLPADLTPFVGQTIPGTGSSLDEQTIYTLEYTGDKPEEINSLQSVDAEGTFAVNISFSENLSRFIPSFKTFRVEFPSYMEIEIPQNLTGEYEVSNGHILQAVNGVKTDKPVVIAVNIKKLNVDGENLKVTDDQMIMEGSVKVSIAWDDIVVGSNNLNDLQLNSAMNIENLTISGATGSFSPKIELNDLGNVTIGELPDFLTNKNVEVDLYNPQIVINIESDLSVPGYLEGTLVAHKNDGTEVSVNIPKVKINAAEDNGGHSHIMICRRHENVPDGMTEVVEIEALKDIIAALPQTSTISFSVVAGAEPSREDSRIELGKTYTIKPSYSIEAPIAFGRNARIVYSDTLDGWNDDLQDIEFANEASLNVTAEIENRIPAYLTMSAHAIDVNGNEIDNLTVDVNSDIQASEDGTTPVTTPISVTIKQKSAGALKAVDGIVFTIEAAAADSNGVVEGITLNAYNHSLLAKNIKVTLKGKVVIDTDD